MAKNRVKVHGWSKTRNRPLLGHPRRCRVRWRGVGRRDEDGIASVALSKWGELGCVDALSPSPEKKKSGLHPTTLVPAFFISPSHPTKSNPDMRNSKLAHTQAGF